MAQYGMKIGLKGNLEEVKSRLLEVLKAQGFGVLTEIDVQQVMKQKLGIDFKAYQILGACNPHYAYRALSADEDIGLLLPCNVVLKEDAGDVEVSIQDPEVMFSVVDDEVKKAMAGFPQEVKLSLKAALEALQRQN